MILNVSKNLYDFLKNDIPELDSIRTHSVLLGDEYSTFCEIEAIDGGIDFDYFDFSAEDNGRISAFALNKIKSSSDCLKSRVKNATFIKTSKLLKAMNIKAEKLIKKISEKIAANSNLAEKIRVTTDILEIYEMDHVQDNSNVANSCMRGKSHYMDLYADLAQNNLLKIAYMLNDEDEVVGRTLLWENAYSDEMAIKIMDRIYSQTPQIEYAFKNFAIKNNYYFKYRQSGCEKSLFSKNHEHAETLNLCISDFNFSLCDYETYPYIDTFTYYNSGILTNNSDVYF